MTKAASQVPGSTHAKPCIPILGTHLRRKIGYDSAAVPHPPVGVFIRKDLLQTGDKKAGSGGGFLGVQVYSILQLFAMLMRYHRYLRQGSEGKHSTAVACAWTPARCTAAGYRAAPPSAHLLRTAGGPELLHRHRLRPVGQQHLGYLLCQGPGHVQQAAVQAAHLAAEAAAGMGEVTGVAGVGREPAGSLAPISACAIQGQCKLVLEPVQRRNCLLAQLR